MKLTPLTRLIGRENRSQIIRRLRKPHAGPGRAGSGRDGETAGLTDLQLPAGQPTAATEVGQAT